MTDSEHAALSAQLARALGWKHCDVTTDKDGNVRVFFNITHGWRIFNYRAPDVYGPLIEWLAERLIVLDPNRNIRLAKQQCWTAWQVAESGPDRRWVSAAYTLPEAVARAVIAIRRDTPV